MNCEGKLAFFFLVMVVLVLEEFSLERLEEGTGEGSKLNGRGEEGGRRDEGEGSE